MRGLTFGGFPFMESAEPQGERPMPERFETIPEDMDLIDMLDPQRFDMHDVFKEFAKAVRASRPESPGLLDAVREGLRHNLGNHVHPGLGLTLLHCAAEAGNDDVVLAISEHEGHAAGPADIHGFKPLHYAAKNAWKARRDSDWNGRFIRAIDCLIENGAHPNAPAQSGMTPLHLAAAAPGTSKNVVLALIDAGADTGARDSKGNTPLHTAALNHSGVDAIRALAERNADFGAVNNDGRTAQDLAAEEHIVTNVDCFDRLLGNLDADPGGLAERIGERMETLGESWRSGPA